jgi:O-acetylserine/cysteine efflux transporter
MKPTDLLLAVLITAVWGTNFVVIRFGLGTFPPFLFAALRFAAAAFPWLLFVPRPRIPWRLLVAFGVSIGAGQFGLLFLALRHDLAPGIASLLLQTQVFYTILIAAVLRNEKPHARQVLALLVAVAGVVLIGWHTFAGHDQSVTVKGLLLANAAAIAWSLSNLIARAAGPVDMLGFMVWSSLFSVPPLLGLALWTTPVAELTAALTHASIGAWVAVLWQGIGNTLLGFGIWNYLLQRYPAATVAPTSLLVPVFGMSSAALLIGEPLPAWKLVAAGLVVGGLALNVWASRARR